MTKSKAKYSRSLVEESLAEVIKERGLQIVSRPEIEANDLVEGSPFSFSAVFEIKPAIEVERLFGCRGRESQGVRYRRAGR